MTKYILCISISVCFSGYIQAQNKYLVADIPDSLKKDAYSVVRDYKLETIANSSTSYTSNYHKVVTVLDNKGIDEALWIYPTDRHTEITSFKGVIYDSNGKPVKTIKRGDLVQTSLSEHLATDNVRYYYQPPAMSCPYTVEYTWEVKGSKGYMDYPSFFPVSERQSLEGAIYILTVPQGTETRSCCLPHDWDHMVDNIGKNTVQTWTVPAMRSIVKDYMDEDDMKLFPLIISEPVSFCYDDTKGDMTSWEDLGAWFYSISAGRDVLPDNVRNEITRRTADCKTNIEKIKAVYDYLAENTRYVSIQLGIGGWQPMSAKEVASTGFGDCKALTNYMQSMLKHVGIESYHALISTTYETLLKDFPNMHQLNHDVLYVPDADGGDYILIECTNPRLPLGFIPQTLCGHEALIIKDGKGTLVKIKGRSEEENKKNTIATIKMRLDGKADMTFQQDMYGTFYEDSKYLAEETAENRVGYIKRNLYTKGTSVNTVNIQDNREDTPRVHADVSAKADYGEIAGSQMFIRCNPFINPSVYKLRNDRIRPIVIRTPFSRSETVTIEIPEGAVIEGLPKPSHYENIFGSTDFNVQQNERSITFTTSIVCHKGRFDNSQKNDFTEFQKQVERMAKTLMVLTIKQ